MCFSVELKFLEIFFTDLLDLRRRVIRFRERCFLSRLNVMPFSGFAQSVERS